MWANNQIHSSLNSENTKQDINRLSCSNWQSRAPFLLFSFLSFRSDVLFLYSSLILLFASTCPASSASLASSCLSGGQPITVWSRQSIPNFCAPGFFCPALNSSDSSTWPIVCPPTIDCQLTRLAGLDMCERQSIYEPSICAPGFYCPTFSQQIECPENHWCPSGSVQPTECEPMSYCPARSSSRLYIGAAFITAVIDIAILIAIRLYRRSTQLVALQRTTIAETEMSQLISVKIGPSQLKVPTHTAVLCRGFDRARKGSKIQNIQFQFDQLTLSIPTTSQKNVVSWMRQTLKAASQYCAQIRNKRSLSNESRTNTIGFTSSAGPSPEPSPDPSPCTSPRNTGTGAEISTGVNTDCSNLRTGLQILSGVSGRLLPGKVTAILGPSGAGLVLYIIDHTLTLKSVPNLVRDTIDRSFHFFYLGLCVSVLVLVSFLFFWCYLFDQKNESPQCFVR